LRKIIINKPKIYEIFDFISDDCKDLLIKLLEIDPRKRVTIFEVINHNFIQQAKIDD